MRRPAANPARDGLSIGRRVEDAGACRYFTSSRRDGVDHEVVPRGRARRGSDRQPGEEARSVGGEGQRETPVSLRLLERRTRPDRAHQADMRSVRAREVHAALTAPIAPERDQVAHGIDRHVRLRGKAVRDVARRPPGRQRVDLARVPLVAVAREDDQPRRRRVRGAANRDRAQRQKRCRKHPGPPRRPHPANLSGDNPRCNPGRLTAAAQARW